MFASFDRNCDIAVPIQGTGAFHLTFVCSRKRDQQDAPIIPEKLLDQSGMGQRSVGIGKPGLSAVSMPDRVSIRQ